LTIAPVTPRFAVPAKVTVTALDVFAERVRPPISKVFPAPVAVIVLPLTAILVMFTAPIFKVVFVPAKVTPLSVLAVTVPAPRLRLLKELVLPAFPKVKFPPHVTALFTALVTACPLVLLIVPPEERVRVPDPRALALFTFKVPAVRVTPPDAAELFPLRVSVPDFNSVRPV